MPSIGIINSVLTDSNSTRGVGFYTRNLYDAIQKEIKQNPDYKNYQVNYATDSPEDIAKHDLIHYPFFNPFSVYLPKQPIKPFIISLHDLIPIQFKKHYPVGIKGFLNWQIQRHRLQQAKYIITISHTSKYIIHQYTNYPLDRIYTTYLASPDNYYPCHDKDYLTKIQKKYHLPSKFVLYIGDIDWSKNIPRLVDACCQLSYPLVIVGKSATDPNTPNHPWTRDLRWVQKHPHPIRLGFVPDEDMNGVLNLATIYCQPSHNEGFGLPPLQALQAGVPIAYSADTAMEEILEDYGEKFIPTSVESIKSSLKKLWTNRKSLRNQIIAGKKHSTSFTWQQTALQTLFVYKLSLLNEK